MPRKSEQDQFTNLLDPVSAEMALCEKPIEVSTKKPGRPKNSEKKGSSATLGKNVTSGKLTKNNQKKQLESSQVSFDEYLKNFSIVTQPQKVTSDYFEKDENYDYNKANKSVAFNDLDFLEAQRSQKIPDNVLDLIDSKNYNYDVLKQNEKDEIGFGISNNQEFRGNPFDFDFGEILKTQTLDPEMEKSRGELGINNLEKLGDLKFIISDILSGDTKALEDPIFKTLGLANVKLAIQWLMDNQGLTSAGNLGLALEPWRLVYRRKPPSMEEFLTEEYIGPDSETLYPWVREMLIEGFDPTKAYRNLIWYYFIGGGKSTASVMSNTYIALCNSLMWNQYKFYGHAQPLDANVQTSSGAVKMGDLKVGDKVLNPTGGESEILEIRPQGKMKVFELNLEDGRSMKCSEQHLFKATCEKDENGEDIWETLSLRHIIDSGKDWYIPDLRQD